MEESIALTFYFVWIHFETVGGLYLIFSCKVESWYFKQNFGIKNLQFWISSKHLQRTHGFHEIIGSFLVGYLRMSSIF